MTNRRVRSRDLPNVQTRCDKTCVYRKNGICDDPRLNKGNGDSACNKENNRDLLARLSKQNTAQQ